MAAVTQFSHRPTQRFAAASPVYELYSPPGRRLRALCLVIAGALASLLAAVRTHAVIVEFPGFANPGSLVTHGDASIVTTADGQVVRLVPASGNNSGNIWGSVPVNSVTFSTAFEFRITNPGGISDGIEVGADGFTFIVQKEGVNVVGGTGDGLGISGIAPSVAVEFDTFKNAADPNSNHVGIDLNGSINSVTTFNVGTKLDNGTKWTAWIDYDGTNLEVRLANNGVRPGSALLTHSLNIPATLDSNTAYIGFTASTGSAWGNYDILSWTYSDAFIAGGVNVPAVPEPETVALLSLGLVVTLRRLRKYPTAPARA